MFSDMHISIMLATMAIFLVMILILNSMLYKPLLRFIDERNSSIKNDENKVKENSQEMLGANDEVEKIHQSTREEIHKIKQSAINQAKKEELERKMASFYVELNAQKEELKQNLLKNLPEFKQLLENNIKKI